MNGDYDKEFVIEFARDVDGKMFMEVMDESLGLRIWEIVMNMVIVEDEDGNFMVSVVEVAEKAEEAVVDLFDVMRDGFFLLKLK